MERELIFWLVLLVVLLVIELATLGLTTIWFAGGAAAAFVASLLGACGADCGLFGSVHFTAGIHQTLCCKIY